CGEAEKFLIPQFGLVYSTSWSLSSTETGEIPVVLDCSAKFQHIPQQASSHRPGLNKFIGTIKITYDSYGGDFLGRLGDSTISLQNETSFVWSGLISRMCHLCLKHLAGKCSNWESHQLVKESGALCDTGKLRLHKLEVGAAQRLTPLPTRDLPPPCWRRGFESQSRRGTLRCQRPRHDLEFTIYGERSWIRVVYYIRLIQSSSKPNPLTRGVLSTVASLYDPLGFMVPLLFWENKKTYPVWLKCRLNDASYLQGLAKSKGLSCTLFRCQCFWIWIPLTYRPLMSLMKSVAVSLVKSRVSPTNVTALPGLELSAAGVAGVVTCFRKICESSFGPLLQSCLAT
ncbi:hypothetical protein NFI96_026624, partial [Prochilodus magdalenae]